MLEPQATTRRERRIAERQAQILEAAAIEFSQKGYGRATTREIAARADLSEGTLYNYFNNKQDLLIGVVRTFADDVTQKIAAIEADNIEDMMTQLLTDRFSSGRERRLFMLFLYEAPLNPDVQRYYVQEAIYRIIDATEQRFRELIASGAMRSVDPATAAQAISATIMGFGALYELGKHARDKNGREPFSAKTMGQDVTDLFFNGMRPAQDGGPHQSEGT